MRTALICVSAAVTWFATAGSAWAWPSVCAPPGAQLVFDVAFSALHENAVIIRQQRGRTLRRFNNYFGRGAGREWHQGAGTWTSPRSDRRQCYEIVGRNKKGRPSARLPWTPSRHRVRRNIVGFEDAGDNDFNDVRVSVRFAGCCPTIRP
ncbi:MAG: DUF4114 domain-containing protein [Hyphomicrobiales bacterium]|nr:DUF4114 domain-containing protein [Hyphomicrobiales bacterium]